MSLFHCGAKLSWCQIVLFSLRCQIVLFPLRCQIVLVPNCPILHSWCQIVLGAKLSSFTLLVPNCPGAKLSSMPNCPRCQIVLGAKLSPNPAHSEGPPTVHGRCGQGSISLEYQTCTSAYLFDTLVTGMGATTIQLKVLAAVLFCIMEK